MGTVPKLTRREPGRAIENGRKKTVVAEQKKDRSRSPSQDAVQHCVGSRDPSVTSATQERPQEQGSHVARGVTPVLGHAAPSREWSPERPMTSIERTNQQGSSLTRQLLQEQVAAAEQSVSSRQRTTTPSIILPESSGSPYSSPLTDNSTTRKRHRLSESPQHESLDGANDRPVKIRRPTTPLTAIKRPISKTASSFLETSPLSVATRTPSTPSSTGNASPQSPGLPESTQDRSFIIRSSQSDEDVELHPPLYEPQYKRPMMQNDEPDPWESDSSLEDVTALFARPKPANLPSSPRTAPKADVGGTGRNTRSRSGYNQPSTVRNSETGFIPLPTPKYKFSLGNLVKQNERETSAQVDIARIRAKLEDKPVVKASEQANGMNEALLTSLVKQEEGEDNVGKILQAMSRAEVLQTETAWHFFGEQSEARLRWSTL